VLSAIPERSGDSPEKRRLSTAEHRDPPGNRPSAARTNSASLSKSEWAHLLHLVGSVEHMCARNRLKLAIRPTFGSIVQGADEIERLLVGSGVGLCLDVAQLFLAGADAVDVIEEAAGRVSHVQLNDLDTNLAYRVMGHSLGYDEAVALGLYRPLGEGGTDVQRIIEALRRKGYRGWYVLDEEVRLASPEDRPLGPISRSLEYVLPLLS
jgi:inosose dehydratase